MKTLSVKNPWAHLIIHGRKDVENRGWQTHYRGSLLIHAGLKIDSQAIPHFHDLGFHSMDLRFGGIIGQVDLVDVVRDSSSPWAIPGEWHWLLAEPRPLEFRPCKGQLGLWEFAMDGEPTLSRAEQIALEL